jgi:hypothetical protein
MGATLPTNLPKQYDVIGIFTDKNLQKILDQAGSEIPNGKSGLIAHINGESANLTLVKRFNDAISVEAVLDYNYSLGKFTGEAELKAIF